MNIHGISIALMHPDAQTLYPASQTRDAERVANDCYAPRKWIDRPQKPTPQLSKHDSIELENALSRATMAKRPMSQARAMSRYWRKEAEVAKTTRSIAAAEAAAARWERKIKELEAKP